MRTVFFILSALLSLHIFSQKGEFNLPDNYYKIVINQSTSKEVKAIFGKPSAQPKTPLSKGCLKYEYPVEKLYYAELGMVIWFERTKEDKTYKMSWIYLSKPSELTIGKFIKIGFTSYETVLKELGEPNGKNEAGILLLLYKELNTDRSYFLTFDSNTKILNEIAISKTDWRKN